MRANKEKGIGLLPTNKGKGMEKNWDCCCWQTKEKGWGRDGVVVDSKQRKRDEEGMRLLLLANKGGRDGKQRKMDGAVAQTKEKGLGRDEAVVADKQRRKG